MLTTAVPEGDDEPDWFYVPMVGEPLDGSAGITLVAPWDGHGMVATQSHALAFDDVPAVRSAWPGHLSDLIAGGPVLRPVVHGRRARHRRRGRGHGTGPAGARADSLRPYEQVEWSQAGLDAWTMAQVFEGGLQAIESGRPAQGAALRTKVAAAQLAESCTARLCKVIGGGTFARRSPFGHWFEDVRALGFLRPPWASATDGLIADSWEPTTG